MNARAPAAAALAVDIRQAAELLHECTSEVATLVEDRWEELAPEERHDWEQATFSFFAALRTRGLAAAQPDADQLADAAIGRAFRRYVAFKQLNDRISLERRDVDRYHAGYAECHDDFVCYVTDPGALDDLIEGAGDDVDLEALEAKAAELLLEQAGAQ